MGFSIPLNRWIQSEKLKNKINVVINETKWESCNIDSKKMIKTWQKFEKNKFCPPSLIWNYLMAGMWIEENIK